MVPEISHRCTSCGASIRDRAMFCPECGKPLVEAKLATNPSDSSEPEIVAMKTRPNEIPAEAVVTAPSSPDPPLTASSDLVDPDGAAPRADGARHGARQRTRDTLHRASNVARGAIEDNVKRVEKIHHVSTVMFEEAHYDPSLRFVLVAVGLFLVFVLLLVLSKVMG